MLGNPQRTFVPDPKYPTSESAARELLRLYRQHTADGYPYAYTGVTNMEFLRSGGTVEEYRAGIAYGVDHGLFTIDGSGSRVTVLAED